MLDISVNDQGTIVILTPETDAGQEWIGNNVQHESWQLLGNGIACDWRAAQAVIDGAQADGLEVA